MIKKFLKHHPIHKKVVPKLDVFFLLRPTLFFAVWVMIAVGMASAQMEIYDFPLWMSQFSLNVFLIYLGISFILSATFIMNQVYDLESDRINKKLLLFDEHYTIEKAEKIIKILLVVGLLISFYSNWIISLIAFGIYLLWGVLYNKEPFSWKKKPILGWFVNIVVGVMLYIIGWNISMENQAELNLLYINFPLLLRMIPYILSYASISLLTAIPDMKGDSITNAQTFPIAFGKINTLILALVLVCISFYIGIIMGDPLISTATLVSLPFFLFCAFRRLDKDILRAIRYPIFILNFFTLPFYPWLVVPLLIVYFLSKYYYWHRFNLHYPALIMDHD